MARSFKPMGIAALAGAASALCMALSSGAYAGSVTEPGVTLGTPAGAPAPEGIYFFNNLNAGNDRAFNQNTLFVEVPGIVWATPYKIFGGQLVVAAAAPSVALGVPATSVNDFMGNWLEELYNPELTLTLAWALGSGWNMSHTFGIYAPSTGFASHNEWVPEYRGAVTYLENGWNITANAIFGFPLDPVNNPYGNPAALPGFALQSPDYFNLDFTAAKTINKWTVGFVAFGSTDLNRTQANITGEQSQIAVGGLIGYDFGAVNANFYFTHDVYVHNYGPAINGFATKGVEDTRIWTSLTVPLWIAPKEGSLKDTGLAMGGLKDLPALPPTWSGFYVGVNAGYGESTDTRGYFIPNTFNSNGYNFDGNFIGAQAGYNWQFGSWVLGGEVDIQGAGNSMIGLVGITGNSAIVNDWGTVRGRVGYAWGPVLFYATGGFAWGDVSILPPVPAAATGFQAGFTPTGWAAGAGFEYRIAPSWSAKLEYQFIDLGRETTINPFDGLAYSQSFNFNTVRLGLNWYLSPPEAPLK